MVVEEVMTPEAVVVNSTTTIHEVLGVMFDAGVRHLPVVDDGELVGIVSDRDLRGFWTPEALAEFEKLSERLSQPVAELMSGHVVSVFPDADIAEAVDLMLEHKIGAVPVVRHGSLEVGDERLAEWGDGLGDKGGGELVGVVSYVDVLRAVRDAL